MSAAAAALIVFYSVLFPAKGWYTPNEPLTVTVKAETNVTLFLTDFAGRPIDPEQAPTTTATTQHAEPVVESTVADLAKGEHTVDVKRLFPTLNTPGTYVLYVLPEGGRSIREFVGTPLVISVRSDRRWGASPGPMVVKVEPLSYAVMSTDRGDMTLAFYYDVAPHTVNNFLSLSSSGFYNNLAFHRIVPGFVLQGGDPRGDGTGGPGYMIDAEFNARPHEAGVLSMARSGDPNEAPGVPPASEFANSAGSQFFICLDYANTQQLDGRYTAFGQVIGDDGMKVVATLAQTPVADPATGRPEKAPVIKSVTVRPVTAKENPYPALQTINIPPPPAPTTAPAEGQ